MYFTLAAIAFAVEDRPWHAGLLAGFCYAVKMTGLLAVPVVLACFLSCKQWRRSSYVIAAAAVPCMPWLARNWIDTGNPLAPFLNAWFPNPYFYVWTEQTLVRNLRGYGVPMPQRIFELLAGTRLQGILGPAFVFAPLALLAFRRHNGPLILLLAAVFSIPWGMNAGARFTMPALPFLAMAMCIALPRAAIAGLVLLHAVTAWPPAIDLYSPNALRLREFPWRAAFRLESEEAYLARTSFDYRYVQMVNDATPPQAKILDLWGAAAVHSTRELLGSWRSAEAVRLVEGLEFARSPGPPPLLALDAAFAPAALCGYRVVLERDLAAPWALHGIEVRRGGSRVTGYGDRHVTSSRLPWEISLALDSNPVSRWWTGEAGRREDYVQVEFSRPVMADSVHLLLPATPHPGLLRIEACRGNNWSAVPALTASAATEFNPRPAAVAMLKQAGITHILTPVAFEGIGVLGERLVNAADEWGLEVVGNRNAVYLLKVR